MKLLCPLLPLPVGKAAGKFRVARTLACASITSAGFCERGPSSALHGRGERPHTGIWLLMALLSTPPPTFVKWSVLLSGEQGRAENVSPYISGQKLWTEASVTLVGGIPVDPVSHSSHPGLT